MKKINDFLKDMTSRAEIAFYDESTTDNELDELKMLMQNNGYTYPNNDLAPFKCLFAYTDEHNLNGLMFEDYDVNWDVLASLRGKPINFDHLRKNVAGFWLGANKIDKNIYAYGVFFKSAFAEEYEELKTMIKNDDLKVSMEARGTRYYNEKESDKKKFSFKHFEFCGGALLRKTKPAFPRTKVTEMAKRLEVASVEDIETFIKVEDNITFIANVLKGTSKEVFKMKELLKAMKEGASEALLTVLSQVEAKYLEIETQLAEKTEVASKLETVITELKAQSESESAKITALQAEIATKVEAAKKEALQIASVKAELGEFAKDMTDEDLLNSDKVEIAKLKKSLFEKEKEIASISKKTDAAGVVIASQSTQKVSVSDEEKARRERIAKLAFGE